MNIQEVLAIVQLILSAAVVPLIKILWDIKNELAALRTELAKDYMLKADFEKYREGTSKTLHELRDFMSAQKAMAYMSKPGRNG
jgi:Tfp pilus assembly protein PilF